MKFFVRQIRRFGNKNVGSYGVFIPANIVRELDLKRNDYVQVSIKKIVLPEEQHESQQEFQDTQEST